MDYSFESYRGIRDVQSRVATIAQRLDRAAVFDERSPPLGRRLVAGVCGQILRGILGEDRRADYFEKAAANPATTTVAGWAADLVQSSVGGFVLSIARHSAWAGVLARCPQVGVLGVGVVKVPISAAVTPATVVPEGSPIPVRKGAFSAGTLTPFKLAAIMSFTDELARSANVEGAIRNLLQQSIADGLDAIAFATSGTGSILAGVTPLTATASGTATEKMLADLVGLLNALTTPSPDTIFIMSPTRALFATAVLQPNFPYAIATTSALTTSVIAVDPAGVAAAIGPEPRIMLSEQAAIHEDDIPAVLSTAGSPNTVSAPVRGLFQSDALGLRVIMHTGWVARTGAVAVVNGVGW